MENLDLNFNSKSSDDVIRETAEFFADQGYSILNTGFTEIVSQPKLFNAYTEALCEGVDANHQAVMTELMNNSAKQILTEAVSGIAPLSSLSMPVIRKLWPRVAMKDAVKTIVAKAPIFSIAYMKPYMYHIEEDGTETRLDLPRGAFGTGINGASYETEASLDLLTVVRHVKLGVNKGFTKVNFLNGVAATPVTDLSTAADTANDAKKVSKIGLDTDFEIVSIKLASTDKTSVDVRIAEKMGLTENLIVPFSYEKTDGTVTGSIVCRVDVKGAYAEVAVMCGDADCTGVEDLCLRAHKSSEWNEESWDVGFDVARQEITIGTGEHIQSPLSVERIQDLQALYNIDATAEVTDLMTNVFANKLDKEIIDFLIKCYINRPANKAFPTSDGYGNSAAHTYEFNVAPSAGYAGSPKAWREELKPVIDHCATVILQETYFTTGTFVIVGNPIDTMLLSNIDWQYKGGAGGNVDGVSISYDIGVFQSTYTYKVVSSINVKPGKLMMSFIPSGDKQICQAYYPYSFTMEKGAGYRSKNHDLVPSIMMTKRHTFHEFTPSVAMIVITGNNGQGQFNKGNLFSNTFASKD